MGNLHYVRAATLMAAVFSVSVVHADDLENRVAQLERMVNARNLSQIEMQQQIDSLTNDVRSLRGALEESNYKLQQATERQKSMYQELDKIQQQAAAQPQPAAGSTPAQPPAQSSDTQAANQAQPPAEAAAQPTPAAVQQPATAPASGSESKDYDAAVALVIKQKNYAQAIPAFDSFIANYPNSSLQPGAHYWLGQLLLNQGDRDKAKAHFLTVAQKYKDSPKRPEAIYKLGVISKADGDADKANKFFQLVIKQYPNTSAAQVAQKAMGG